VISAEIGRSAARLATPHSFYRESEIHTKARNRARRTTDRRDYVRSGPPCARHVVGRSDPKGWRSALHRPSRSRRTRRSPRTTRRRGFFRRASCTQRARLKRTGHRRKI